MVTKRDQDPNTVRRPTHAADIEKQIREVQVAREGNKITLPLDMEYDTAIRALQQKKREEDVAVALSFEYDLTVPEGALTLFLVLNDLFGFVNSMSTPGFFGDKPPTIINVQVARDKSVSIPWGRFSVPGIPGYIQTSMDWRNKVPYFHLNAEVPGKFKSEIQRIHDAILARKESVYQGTAISLAFPEIDDNTGVKDFFPRFMNVASIEPSDLVFSEDVEEILGVSLFTPIQHTQRCRDHKIPLKRGVLLEGPYGVGKTCTASVTATLCERNGWTFVHLPQIKDLSKAYAFAKHHQPAVIFCEDLDEVLKDEDERNDTINSILNSIDGIESKDTEIITVFTTNNVDDITQAMLRPGRIDTVVPVRAPDARAVTRLIRLYAAEKLNPNEDLSVASALLAGKNAAVVREVVERSKLGAISRLEGPDAPMVISARDVEVAARGMDAHNKLLEPKPVDERSDIEKAADLLGGHLKQLGVGHNNGAPNGAVKAFEGGSGSYESRRNYLEGPKGSAPDAE